jgi:hypothetical protein
LSAARARAAIARASSARAHEDAAVVEDAVAALYLTGWVRSPERLLTARRQNDIARGRPLIARRGSLRL